MSGADVNCRKKSALILRTHYFDQRLAEISERYAANSGMPFAVVTDETKGIVEVPAHLRKLSMNKDILGANDLLIFDNLGWWCGDYSLILAAKHMIDTEYFWMIEPDVHIDFDNLDEFFELFDHADDIDLIAPEYGDAPEHWAWYSSVEKSDGKAVKRCLFPIVRASRRLINHVHQKRISGRLKFSKEKWGNAGGLSPAEWPNDEAIVSNAVNEIDFIGKNINEFEKLYDRATFNVGHPISFKYINGINGNNSKKIFHPILHGDMFVNKIKTLFKNDLKNADDIHKVDLRYSSPEILIQIFLEKNINEIESFAKYKYDLIKNSLTRVGQWVENGRGTNGCKSLIYNG